MPMEHNLRTLPFTTAAHLGTFEAMHGHSKLVHTALQYQRCAFCALKFSINKGIAKTHE